MKYFIFIFLLLLPQSIWGADHDDQGFIYKKLLVPHLIQGKAECAPTSLAMVMKYHGINVEDHHEIFYSDTVGHSPIALKRKAKERGFIVRLVNKGSIKDVRKLIDHKIPVIVYGTDVDFGIKSIYETIRIGISGHVVVISGYMSDTSGNVKSLHINDPSDRKPHKETLKEFKKNYWDNRILWGWKNYYLAIALEGSKQAVSLNEILPQDQASFIFDLSLKGVNLIEEVFYSIESSLHMIHISGKINFYITFIVILGLFIGFSYLIFLMIYRLFLCKLKFLFTR